MAAPISDDVGATDPSGTGESLSLKDNNMTSSSRRTSSCAASEADKITRGDLVVLVPLLIVDCAFSRTCSQSTGLRSCFDASWPCIDDDGVVAAPVLPSCSGLLAEPPFFFFRPILFLGAAITTSSQHQNINRVIGHQHNEEERVGLVVVGGRRIDFLDRDFFQFSRFTALIFGKSRISPVKDMNII